MPIETGKIKGASLASAAKPSTAEERIWPA
jgi:hypothetical protein